MYMKRNVRNLCTVPCDVSMSTHKLRWYIYLHDWVFLLANVGTCFIHEAHGMCIYIYIYTIHDVYVVNDKSFKIVDVDIYWELPGASGDI